MACNQDQLPATLLLEAPIVLAYILYSQIQGIEILFTIHTP
jgi:hypothetical protein